MEIQRATYAEYLRSEVWQEKRAAALDRANHACQLCNRTKNLHVHHRTYERIGGDELPEDLTVLCATCHEHFHGIGGGPKRTVKPTGRKKAPGSKKTRKAEARERINTHTKGLVEAMPVGATFTDFEMRQLLGLSNTAPKARGYMRAKLFRLRAQGLVEKVGEKTWRVLPKE